MSVNDAGVDASSIDMGRADGGSRDSGAPDAGNDAGPSCTSGCGIAQVEAGFWHTCARRENGQVLCWGNNLWSELGDNSGRHMTCPPVHEGIVTDCSVNPVQPVGFTDATDIAVHRSTNSCARHADGSWQCWGVSFVPATGMPTQNASPVSYPSLSGAVQVANTSSFACMIVASGAVECVGYNDGGELGDGTNVQRTSRVANGVTGATQLDVGSSHACALLSDGHISCWGSNQSGQLGDGITHGTCGAGARQYDCALTPVQVALIDDATQVATGASHTCALRADHTVWCWGGNSYGALGSGEEADELTPVQVDGLSNVSAIAAGDNNTCALNDSGAIYCWGANQRGTLGDGATTHSVCSVDSNDCSRVPVSVATIDDATAITVGGAHACAIRGDESVWCWGYNVDYQLGVSPNTDINTPTQVTSLNP
jgi:alpha-tubulin suppressor-like RCC1 family protein